MASAHFRVIVDSYTAETLRSMVTYIPCDKKIAAYLDIPERTVRAARRRLPLSKQRQVQAGRAGR